MGGSIGGSLLMDKVLVIRVGFRREYWMLLSLVDCALAERRVRTFPDNTLSQGWFTLLHSVESHDRRLASWFLSHGCLSVDRVLVLGDSALATVHAFACLRTILSPIIPISESLVWTTISRTQVSLWGALVRHLLTQSRREAAVSHWVLNVSLFVGRGCLLVQQLQILEDLHHVIEVIDLALIRKSLLLGSGITELRWVRELLLLVLLLDLESLLHFLQHLDYLQVGFQASRMVIGILYQAIGTLQLHIRGGLGLLSGQTEQTEWMTAWQSLRQVKVLIEIRLAYAALRSGHCRGLKGALGRRLRGEPLGLGPRIEGWLREGRTQIRVGSDQHFTQYIINE